MTRRHLLDLIELTLVTVTLAAALVMLAHAEQYHPAQWVDPALAGAMVAMVLLVPTVLALLLIAVVQHGPDGLRALRTAVVLRVWEARAARLRRKRARRRQPDGRSRPGEGHRAPAPVKGRHGRHDGRTVPMPPLGDTLVMAAVTDGGQP